MTAGTGREKHEMTGGGRRSGKRQEEAHGAGDVGRGVRRQNKRRKTRLGKLYKERERVLGRRSCLLSLATIHWVVRVQPDRKKLMPTSQSRDTNNRNVLHLLCSVCGVEAGRADRIQKYS